MRYSLRGLPFTPCPIAVTDLIGRRVGEGIVNSRASQASQQPAWNNEMTFYEVGMMR